MPPPAEFVTEPINQFIKPFVFQFQHLIFSRKVRIIEL